MIVNSDKQNAKIFLQLKKTFGSNDLFIIMLLKLTVLMSVPVI